MMGKGEYTWPNGDTYEGEFRCSRLHGYGTLCTATYTYTGNFFQGKKHDMQGLLILAHNGREMGRYEGEIRDDELSGDGIYTYANGDVYCGRFLVGRRHSSGKYYKKHRDGMALVFNGSWLSDNFIEGIAYRWDETTQRVYKVFEGRYGYVSMKGKWWFANGDWYEGGTWSNQMAGQGIYYTAADQSTYTGEFVISCKHGPGVLHFTKGEYAIFEGTFVNGVLEGFVVVTLRSSLQRVKAIFHHGQPTFLLKRWMGCGKPRYQLA
jgi:hypothetical protein